MRLRGEAGGGARGLTGVELRGPVRRRERSRRECDARSVRAVWWEGGAAAPLHRQ